MSILQTGSLVMNILLVVIFKNRMPNSRRGLPLLGKSAFRGDVACNVLSSTPKTALPSKRSRQRLDQISCRLEPPGSGAEVCGVSRLQLLAHQWIQPEQRQICAGVHSKQTGEYREEARDHYGAIVHVCLGGRRSKPFQLRNRRPRYFMQPEERPGKVEGHYRWQEI